MILQLRKRAIRPAAALQARHLGRATRGSFGGKVKVVLTTWILTAVVVTSVGFGLTARKEAQAQVINFTIGDLMRELEFYIVEEQEILVDLIRKVIIEQITKNVIERVIGGQNGGIGGGGGGTSGNGSGAFISDYSQFLYVEAAIDTQNSIDDRYSGDLPTYMDPAVRQLALDSFDPDYNLVPDDCVDMSTIDIANDPDALIKLDKSLNFGCNELSAQYYLLMRAAQQYALVVNASEVEALANAGAVKKDEDTNELKQSGIVYQGIVQGALAAVYNVHTENESAVASILGAFADQLIDQILDQEFI
jgi:hypothetical protein